MIRGSAAVKALERGMASQVIKHSSWALSSDRRKLALISPRDELHVKTNEASYVYREYSFI